MHRKIRPILPRAAAAAAVLFGLFVAVPPVHANDTVLEWNQIALAATVTAAQGPVPQIRSMAIVHVAMHDAVNGITRDYRTYLMLTRRVWGASPDAAAIARSPTLHGRLCFLRRRTPITSQDTRPTAARWPRP
jgi:hypothetical protein